MEYRRTSRDLARGARPDGVADRRWYLVKNTSRLRLTYQIRLLTFACLESERTLTLAVPRSCVLSADLRRFVRENHLTVLVDRFD